MHPCFMRTSCLKRTSKFLVIFHFSVLHQRLIIDATLLVTIGRNPHRYFAWGCFLKILRRITTARAGLAILPNVPTVPEFLPVSRSKASGRRLWDRLCHCSTRRLRRRIGAPRDDDRG